jgi:hypothetical protein
MIALAKNLFSRRMENTKITKALPCTEGAFVHFVPSVCS